jgi:hypothetical protein
MKMATIEEKQELIDTLKFTPTTCKLNIWGYGGEIAVGRITPEQYNFWKPVTEEHGDSLLVNHCTDYTDEDQPFEIPEEAKFCTDGNWYEVDDIEHMSGAEFSDHNSIEVEDDKGSTVWSGKLGHSLEDEGVEIESSESFASEAEDCTHYHCFQSTEKGTFFSGEFTLRAPFDPKKLKIYTTDVEGWELVSSVHYDGEEIEGQDGYDTTGKGYYASVNEV